MGFLLRWMLLSLLSVGRRQADAYRLGSDHVPVYRPAFLKSNTGDKSSSSTGSPGDDSSSGANEPHQPTREPSSQQVQLPPQHYGYLPMQPQVPEQQEPQPPAYPLQVPLWPMFPPQQIPVTQMPKIPAYPPHHSQQVPQRQQPQQPAYPPQQSQLPVYPFKRPRYQRKQLGYPRQQVPQDTGFPLMQRTRPSA